MIKPTPKPSEIIESFLTFIDRCRTDYASAVAAVDEADKKELIDLVHDMEFANDKQERSRIATKIHYSRLDRRKNKDTVNELEDIVKFFDEPNHKNTVTKISQLLYKQRKTEEYLNGQRVYKRRKDGDKS